jgi:hypothetical protein
LSTFYMSFDRKFQGEQEYMFPEFFQGFLPFEKSKKLKGVKQLDFSPFFIKLCFQVLCRLGLFKLPYSCSALKTQLENGLKTVSDINVYPQGRRQRSDQNSPTHSCKLFTSFPWDARANIFTWLDSLDAPLQKYTCSFLKFLFLTWRSILLSTMLNRSSPFRVFCKFCWKFNYENSK